MCDGMAGELGTGRELSCTSRSNICDPAGEITRGDDDDSVEEKRGASMGDRGGRVGGKSLSFV